MKQGLSQHLYLMIMFRHCVKLAINFSLREEDRQTERNKQGEEPPSKLQAVPRGVGNQAKAFSTLLSYPECVLM